MLRNLNQSSSGTRILGIPKTGVLAENIPATGDNGPGYAYRSLSFPADNGKEICGTIITRPASGSLVAYEDTSYEFSGASDGPYWFDWRLKVNDVASVVDIGYGPGIARVFLQVGPAYAAVSTTTDDAVFSGGATVTVVSSAQIIATTDDSVFTGGAVVAGTPVTVIISATTDDAVFSGGAVVSGVVSVSISATTDDAVFSGTSVSGGTWSGSISDEDIARIVAAVLAALQATAIPVNATKMNGHLIIGDGTEANRWRAVGVPN